MDSTDIAIAKLLNVFNHAIDKATGPDAVSLINNYMMYIMVSNIFALIMICGWAIFNIYMIRMVLVKYNEYRESDTNGLDSWMRTEKKQDTYHIYLGVSIFISMISVPILVGALPQVLAVIYDPRLHFVFKVMR